MAFDTSFFRMANIFSPGSSFDEGSDDGIYRPKKTLTQPGIFGGADDGIYRGGDSISSRVKDRMSNIFAPTAKMQPDPSYQPAQTPETPEDTYMRRFKEMTDTSGPAQEEYRKFIDTMPSREDYAPGKMRSFVAALAGGVTGFKDPSKGIALAERVRDTPYDRAIEDFSLKAKGKQEAAQEERQSLTARRQILNDALVDKQRWGVIPSQVTKNEAAATKDTAQAADTRAKTADRPAELDIKKRATEAKIALDGSLEQLAAARATGEPALIAAATENAKARMLEAQAAGVNAAANTVRAEAAKTTAGAAVTRANQQPTFETYHTPEDEKTARSEAIKKVIASNNKYYGFGEADKQGKLTGGIKPYEKPGAFNVFGTDRSADYADFQRKVDQETKAWLDRNARKRKTGGPTGTATVSDFLNSLPDR